MFLTAAVIKISLGFCFLFSILQAEETAIWSNAVTNAKDKTLTLFEIGGKPTPLLKEILVLEGIYDENDRFQEIRAKTQKKWLACLQGQKGIERRDLVDSEEASAKKEQIAAIMSKMGLFDASIPYYTYYDYAIVVGAFLPAIQDRIDQLVALERQGIHFDHLIALTGERPLREDEKEAINRPDLYFETDLFEILFEKLPNELKKSVTIISAKAVDGKRPTIETTYAAWMEQKPKPGTILVISSPLFVWLQHLNGKKMVPPSFTLDTVSRGVSLEDIQKSGYFKTAVLLDTLAKMIYNIDESMLCTQHHS